MKAPETPADEAARLAELEAYRVLDTASEEAFDAIVRIAAFVAGTPIALVSLIDENRQWFKAKVGLEVDETSREISFCGHVVAGRDMLVVPDASQDDRFSDNPLVVGQPDIRFYAGAPLTTPSEQVVGTLCVIDRKPAELTGAQREILQLLADQVVRLLEIRKQAVEWKRHRDEARAFFETSLDLLCVADFDGYFVDLNEAWTAVLGYDSDELKSTPFIQFIHPDDAKTVGVELQRLRAEDGEIRDFVIRFKTKDGGLRRLQFNATVEPSAGHYIAVARDVTDAEGRRVALEEARSAAEQASAAKSVFLANMSHELRTPLNSVIGFSNILRRNKQGNLTEKELDYLERIGRNGRHLLTLLNDILDLSKIEVGRIELTEELVDLKELVKEVHSTLAAENDQLTVEIADGLGPISADRLRFRQVLTNLVGNALKFTPQGRVTTRVVSREGRPVRLDVSDEGIGIAPENLERIFEPFEQEDAGTERKYGGTGLGLAISKSLVDAMGFEITVKSTLGEGTTFSIHFDRTDSANADPPPVVDLERAESRVRVASGTGPVLIVDDEPESRLLLETVVADLGIPVVAVDSPSLAIAIAEAIRPRAVLLDLMMPVVDGFDVLQQFESHPVLKSTPVVVVSIVGTENRHRLTHAVEVANKPLDADELARILGSRTARGGRILVVDDDAEARTLVGEVIVELGSEVVEAADGVDALTRLSQGDISAVVLDLGMPRMNGIELLHRLRKDARYDDLPVVVFSANTDEYESSVGDSVVAVVNKDGDVDHLQKILRGVLGFA